MRISTSVTLLSLLIASAFMSAPVRADQSYQEWEQAQRDKERAEQENVDRENAFLEYEAEERAREQAEPEPYGLMDILFDRRYASQPEGESQDEDEGPSFLGVALVAVAGWLVYEVYFSEPNPPSSRHTVPP